MTSASTETGWWANADRTLWYGTRAEAERDLEPGETFAGQGFTYHPSAHPCPHCTAGMVADNDTPCDDCGKHSAARDPMKVWTWPKAEQDAYAAKLERFTAGYDPERDDPGEAGELDDPDYRARVAEQRT